MGLSKGLRLYKVVVDTNIFISGFLFGGNPGKILELLKKNSIQIVLSPEIEFELFSKLEKFSVNKETIYELKSLIEKEAIKVTPVKKTSVCRDPKDNMLLEVCQKSKADFLITGDKDLIILKNFKQTKIVTPKEFLSNL